MKSEPSVYSIDDLRKDKRTSWEGVRNYQARNFMRDDMNPGDLVLFYHSNAKPPAVVGIAEVACKAYPDHAAFEVGNKYYDPKSTPEKPIWFMVDVNFKEKAPKPLALEEIKNDPKLDEMMAAQKGSRLSVQPVSEEHFKYICKITGIVGKK